VAHALVRAASALVPTLTSIRFSLCLPGREYGKHECVRHIMLPPLSILI